MQMRVLLTNDDGIQAVGLQTLRRALLPLPATELALIALRRQRSTPARPRPQSGHQHLPDRSENSAMDGCLTCGMFDLFDQLAQGYARDAFNVNALSAKLNLNAYV